MNNLDLIAGTFKSFPLKSFAFGLTVFLSACASNPANNPASTGELLASDPRSELVFLNVEEASGWVAYNCSTDGGSGETEDYRIVVIRQNSGEIIYDSQIPLASDLCTHGFELSPEDPRLKKIGQNVDREIIEPLEAYQKSIEQALDTSTVPSVRNEEKTEAIPDEPAKPTEKLPEELTTPSGMKISGMENNEVFLELGKTEAPAVGSRFFLRTSPLMVKIPGTDESLITSEGEVTGLVEVTSVENNVVRTKLLSGEVPEDGFAEPRTTP